MSAQYLTACPHGHLDGVLKGPLQAPDKASQCLLPTYHRAGWSLYLWGNVRTALSTLQQACVHSFSSCSVHESLSRNAPWDLLQVVPRLALGLFSVRFTICWGDQAALNFSAYCLTQEQALLEGFSIAGGGSLSLTKARLRMEDELLLQRNPDWCGVKFCEPCKAIQPCH